MKIVTRSREVHGLNKIPDSILLKECRTEIGKNEAYIIELQDIISKNIDAKKNVQMEKNNRKLMSRNNKLRKELNNIKRTNLNVENEKLIDFVNYLNKIHDYTIREYEVGSFLEQYKQ